MKIKYETLHELFSDDAEMRIFQYGPYAPPKPLFTYDPNDGCVYDSNGWLIDKLPSGKEFKKQYPHGMIFKAPLK